MTRLLALMMLLPSLANAQYAGWTGTGATGYGVAALGSPITITSGAGVGTHTTSVNTGTTGSNRVLTTSITTSGNCASIPPDVTGVTYNGVSMTQVAYGFKTDAGCSAGVGRVYLFALAAPAIGSNNLTVTIGSNGDAGFLFYGFAQTWTGANQTTPIRAYSSSYDVSGSQTDTITISSSTSDVLVNHACAGGGGTYITIDTGQTEVFRANGDGGSTCSSMVASTKAGTAGTGSMGMVYGSISDWFMHMAFSVQP